MITIDELKAKKQWICWDYEWEGDKLIKVPKNPYTGYRIDITQKRYFSTYEYAKASSEKREHHGVGLVLSAGMFVIDIDADKDVATGEISKNRFADNITDDFFETYIERSPSGDGLHILGMIDSKQMPYELQPYGSNKRYKLNKSYYQKNSIYGIEFYSGDFTDRYISFTEELYSDTLALNDMTHEVLSFLDRYMKKDAMAKEKPKPMVKAVNSVQRQWSDSEITSRLNGARRSKKGPLFIALYDNGDMSKYKNDHSRADEALCSMLAFWFDSDKSIMDALFRKSALCRDKWTEREDYRERTMDKAISTLYYQRGEKKRKDKIKVSSIIEKSLESILVEAEENNYQYIWMTTEEFISHYHDLLGTFSSVGVGRVLKSNPNIRQKQMRLPTHKGKGPIQAKWLPIPN